MTRPEDISERAWEAAKLAFIDAIEADGDNPDFRVTTHAANVMMLAAARAINAETELCAKIADMFAFDEQGVGDLVMSGSHLALTREQAAELCGLAVTGFDSWVRRGIVPGPIKGTRRWSRAALERSLAGVRAEGDDAEAVFAQWLEKHG